MPSGFLDHDGDPGQVLRRGGVGFLVRGVEGEGQHASGSAGVRGAQRHECLFGERRVAVGFLRGGREGLDVLQQLRDPQLL